MSLENEIKKLREAVEANTAALQNRPVASAAALQADTNSAAPAETPKVEASAATDAKADPNSPEYQAAGKVVMEVINSGDDGHDVALGLLNEVQPGAQRLGDVLAKNLSAVEQKAQAYLAQKKAAPAPEPAKGKASLV